MLTTMLSDLVFLHGGSFPRCTARLDKKFDGYCTLQYSDGGAVELSYDGRPAVLRGKWFWTAYPGPRVKFGPAPGHVHWDHRYLAFAGPRVARWTAEGVYPHGPVRAPRGGRYGVRFDALLAAVRGGGRVGRLRALNLLEGILIDLAEAKAETRSTSAEPWLVEVTRALSPDGGEDADRENDGASRVPIDYAALASRASMGLSTFRRRFKLAAGMSPHAFLLQARAARARELLGGGDIPIKTIAERLGFRDVFFFTRQFKRLTGVSPGEYRRSRQV